jgi:hypothetical protein
LYNKQIRNQIVRRALTDQAFDPRLFELLGIDPNGKAKGEEITTYPELDDFNLEEDDSVVHGTVPFELQVGVLGVVHTFDCRVVYSAALGDDGSITAIFTDVLGECAVQYQRLTWSPIERGQIVSSYSGPKWIDFQPDFYLAPEIRQLLLGLIEADALHQLQIDA